MSELISGKDAKLVWANGEQLQVVHKIQKVWEDLNDKHPLAVFTSNEYIFRLKPRTITINGIEVPACGENYKEGDDVYVLDDCCDERGYVEYSVSGYNFEGVLPKLWWRTEDEIKQVVEALRKVFNT